MPRDRQRHIEEIFMQAVDLPKEARVSFLRQRCEHDSSLRREVEALLVHDDRAGSFMSGAAASAAAGASDQPAQLPDHLGAYRIIRQIGAGGMGVVYEAQQDNPRRSVALKVVRPGTISRQVLRRFAYESEVLGQLRHAGIAQIYEAGEFDGAAGRQPFFAMELIIGEPLDRYCRRRSVPVRGRLELMAQICDAASHAHGRGVIHRDLKPGNILVDEAGQVKVLDFGVARLTTDRADKTTVVTSVGQMIGTLPYMSPEQVGADSSAVDARTDVYALGVIMYELLAGRLPHDVGTMPIPEAIRVIREDEPTGLAVVSGYFRGDIDTIVGKAIAKDAGRRYQSAAELAADIRRFLHDEPIHARPTGTFYQLGKFARRNRALVGGVLATMLVLAAGVAVSVYLAIGQAHQRRIADDLTTQAILKERTAQRIAYNASIAAALGAAQSSDTVSLRSRLAATPQALRGWEWKRLSFLADRSLGRADVTLAPRLPFDVASDGVVFLGLHDGRIVLWDGDSAPTPLFTFAQPAQQISCSRDGSRILAIYEDRMVMLDRSGSERWSKAGRYGFWGKAFEPGDARLLVGDRAAGEAVILDSTSGASLGRMEAPDAGVVLAGWSNTGKYYITGGQMMIVRDSASFGVIGPRDLMGPVFSGDDSFFVHRVDQGDGAMIETATGRSMATIPIVRINVPSWGIGDRTIICGEGIGTVDVFDPTSLERRDSILVGAKETRVVMMPDGRHFIAASAVDARPRLFDAAMSAQPWIVRSGVDSIGCGLLSPDGRSVATGGWGTIALWDTGEGIRTRTYAYGEEWAVAVAWSPDSSAVAGVTELGRVAVVRGPDLWASPPAGWGGGPRPSVVWTAQDRFCYSLGDTLYAARVTGPVGVEIAPEVRRLAVPIRTLACHPSAGLLAIGLDDGSIIVERLGPDRDPSMSPGAGSGGVIGTHASNIHSLAFSPDGTRLASTSADGGLYIWDVSPAGIAGGDAPTRLVSQRLDGQLFSVSWSPDGSRLVIAGETLPLAIVDSATGEDLLRLRSDSPHPPSSAAFSPDGATLYAIGPPYAWAAFETEIVSSPTLRQTRYLAESAQKAVSAWRLKLYAGEPLREAIRTDASLAEDVRELAIRIAAGEGDCYRWSNSLLWAGIQQASQPPDLLARAVALGETICERFPESGRFLNTLGIAYYRTGRYADALRTLERSHELNAAARGRAEPTDLAGIVMSLVRLNDRQRAEHYYAQLQELMASPDHRGDGSDLLFATEARELMERSR